VASQPRQPLSASAPCALMLYGTLPLESLQVASPCKESWDAMTGTDRVRFCSRCGQNVYNISQFTREEAEELIQQSERRLCTRLYRRRDGTVLTKDCPVGVRAIRRWLGSFAALAAAIMILALGWLLPSNGGSQELRVRGSSLREVEPFRTIMEWIEPSPTCTMGTPAPMPLPQNSGQGGSQVDRGEEGAP
jgi:hypothetical protein